MPIKVSFFDMAHDQAPGGGGPAKRAAALEKSRA
jgi:hypothetical protein